MNTSVNSFDPKALRADFPILDTRVHGDKRLVYLDNAATTQRPRQVVQRISDFYTQQYSNVIKTMVNIAAQHCPNEIASFQRCRQMRGSKCDAEDMAAMRCASRVVLATAKEEQEQ